MYKYGSFVCSNIVGLKCDVYHYSFVNIFVLMSNVINHIFISQLSIPQSNSQPLDYVSAWSNSNYNFFFFFAPLFFKYNY